MIGKLILAGAAAALATAGGASAQTYDYTKIGCAWLDRHRRSRHQ